MRIKLEDLDSTIKERILSILREASMRKYRTLPSTSDIDSIKSIIEESRERCIKEIQEYYRVISERDIECEISDDDFMSIYLRLV